MTTQLVALAGALHVAPPGEEVTVYPVIGAPPLLDGAVKKTVALALSAVAEIEVGAPGTVAGVALTDTVEDSESPTPLVAMTRKVYSVPFERPSTVTGDAELLPVKPPGSAITVYVVIADPLLPAPLNVIVT